MHVGDRLRELREAAGLNLPEAAAIAGTSKQSASQIEKGVTKVPGGLFLYRWSQHYGVNLEWLITGKGTAQQSQSHLVGFTGPMLASAIRMARGAVEAKGMDDFDPVTDPGDAELLALALEDVIEEGIEQAGDSDVLRFARKVNKAGAGKDGKAGSNRSDGGSDSRTGEAQAGGKVAATGGRRRKSAA